MDYYITTKEQIQESVIGFIRNNSIIAYDVEANGLDPHTNQVLLIQIGTSEKQFVLDVAKLGKDLITLVLKELNSPDILKVMHNAKYDFQMTLTNFGVELNPLADTILADYLLSQGKNVKRHSLDIVLSKYLGINVSKEEQSSFVGMKLGSEFTEKQLEYAREDAEHLVPLLTHLTKLLKDRDMYKLALLEYNTVRATSALELNGIHINQDKWLALKDVAQKRAAEAKKELDKHFEPFCKKDMFGELDINYNSPKQLLAILPKIIGIELTSTAEDRLRNISHPAVRALLNYRKQTKRVSTYGEEFLTKHLNPKTNRIYADFWQLGTTDSGRYSSDKPNLQNIPSEQVYRSAFTAKSDDYRIISADFSGQELRLLTQLSKEPKFVNCLAEGKDLHTLSASLVFDIPYDTVTKDKRKIAKSLNFGIIYGMGPRKLSNELNIPYAEALSLQKKFFQQFPRIKALMNMFAAQAKDRKYAYSPLDKRRRDLSTFDFDDGRQVGHAINIAKNLPFQGAGASVTKLALYKIYDTLKENNLDAYLVNAVHDEIIVESHKDCAIRAAQIIEEEMVKAFNYFAPDVEMTVQPEIDTCWIH